MTLIVYSNFVSYRRVPICLHTHLNNNVCLLLCWVRCSNYKVFEVKKTLSKTNECISNKLRTLLMKTYYHSGCFKLINWVVMVRAKEEIENYREAKSDRLIYFYRTSYLGESAIWSAYPSVSLDSTESAYHSNRMNSKCK